MNAHPRFHRRTALLALVVLFASALRLPAAPPRALAAASAAPAAPVAASPAAATATSWVFQGPAPQINAQTSILNSAGTALAATDQQQTNGAVRAIAPSPTNPDTVYIGSSGGGVWKTTNFQSASPTWTPLTDSMPSLGIWALAFDPSDATEQTLVAGSGPAATYTQGVGNYGGVYLTTNGGATWTQSSSSLPTSSSYVAVAARGSTLLAGSSGGLYRTTTGVGGTWAKISGTSPLPAAPVYSIVGDPKVANRLYVTFTGASGGIFRSDDSGASWTNIGTGITGIDSTTNRLLVAVYNDGTTSVVTVSTTNRSGGVVAYYVFRSVNGAAFVPQDAPPLPTPSNPGEINSLVADKTNSNIVYAAGYGSSVNNGVTSTAVYRLDASLPSGSQATILTQALTSTPSSAMNYGSPHSDNRSMAIDAAGGLIDGCDGAVYRLPVPSAPASSTNRWVPKDSNLNITEAVAIAYDELSHVLLVGLQDNGTPYQTARGSTTWYKWLGGDGGIPAVDNVTLAASNQSIRYGSSGHLGDTPRLYRQVYDANGNAVASSSYNGPINYGADLHNLLPAIPVADLTSVPPMVLDAANPQRILIAGKASLYESQDMGTTFASISAVGIPQNFATSTTPIVYGGYKNGVANPDLIYIGSGTQVYARTTAGGAVAATAALPGSPGTILSLTVDPADYTHVFASDSAHVYESKDGGGSWSDITGGLGSLQATTASPNITALGFVPGPSGYIVAGTQSGAFASSLANLGAWIKLGAGLPTVPIYQFLYDAKEDFLAAATLGRGAWTLPNASTAFIPSNVAPILTLSGATAATESGTYQNSYSFTVNDPGDRFTTSGPTITGGSLVAGSLSLTASGGGFKVIFPDGPTTASISLKVTDSTGLDSNTATVSVSVANAAPTVTINGSSTGTAGTSINLTSTVTDQSPVDQAAGFTYLWFVYRPTGAAAISNGSAASYSFTPSIAGTYTVYLNATDKDGSTRQGSKVITVGAAAPAAAFTTNVASLKGDRVALKTASTSTAASSDLTADAASVAVGEGATAFNSGTFQNANGNPVTLSASAGTLTRQDLIGCMTPPANLVSWWHAENNANDSIGSNNGTLQNGAGFVSGIVGQAFSFDGANDYVNVPSDPSIDLRNNLTVMAWFKINSMAPGSFAKVFSKRNAAADYSPFEVSLAYNGTTITANSQASTTGSSWNVSVAALQPLSLGSWYHVAFVMDGNNLHSLYLNGQLQGTQQLSAPLKASAGDAFTIGTSSRGFPLNGLVDEVEIVNRALSASEIQGIYSNCPAPAVFGNWQWSYATDDGPAQSQNVTITATDDVNGDVTHLSFPLTVLNDGPTATFANGGAASEGSSGTVSFSNQSDPSTADTSAGFRYAYDFDNDGVFDSGDGTYGGSVTNASATVPAGFLAEGPAVQTVHGRIVDKDGGYADYTTDITIDNVAPTASVSGPASTLAGRQVTFVASASDPSAADQAAGFAYSIDWGDGSPALSIARAAGNGSAAASHTFAAAGNYTVQVTAADKDGAASAPASTSIHISSITASSLQSLIGTTPVVQLAAASDADLQSVLAAVNGLNAPASPVAITVVLGAGTYSHVTLSPPDDPNISLLLTGASDGTSTIQGVTVTSGNVAIQASKLTTAANTPTVQIQDGDVILAGDDIEESTGSNNVALDIANGHVELELGLVLNINGSGRFLHTYAPDAIEPNTDQDAFLTPNTFSINGVPIVGLEASSVVLASSANPSLLGQSVTFTAQVHAEAAAGAPTGAISFYDGTTLLNTVALDGQAAATFTTTALGVGYHTINAIYQGDGLYGAGSATVLQRVTVPPNHAPVAVGDSYNTLANTALTVAAPGVLSNDTDADHDALTAIKVGNPAHGTVTLNANGSFTYAPASGYVGGDSFTYKANDGKVDSNVATVTIAVKYNFAGFFGTVLNPPTLNSSTAGQNIAFVFSLGGNFGLNIFASSYPASQQINCSTGAPIGTLQQVPPAANLNYSPTTGRYTYTAKTDKKWAGTCRQFNLRTADGTDHLARFKFK